MERHLEELARYVDGTLVGDGQLCITAASTLADCLAGHITLVDHPDKVDRLHESDASAAVVPRGMAVDLPRIEVDDVHESFSRLVSLFRQRRKTSFVGVSPSAHVSETARLGTDVVVYPGATVGDDVEIGVGSVIHTGVVIMPGCRIGRDVTLFPGAVLYEDTVVGDRSLVHAGAVIGAFGFGYRMTEGRHQLCAQLGNVEIGDDVEIGAGTTVDRGTYGSTRIGTGTKIDNQVQIGHNCRIGAHNLICSQAGIAGSTTTGDYVVIAGQVGIRDHVHIGERSVLGAMSGVSNDVPAGVSMLGIPATPEREQKLKQAALSKLPEMRRQWKKLAAQLESLQTRVEQLSSAPTSTTKSDPPNRTAAA